MKTLERAVVVIPAFNEEPVIYDVISRLAVVFSQIVCVDDGSSDATAARAVQAGALVIRHPINRGQGAALQTGLDWIVEHCMFDAVVTFDADGQHRVDDAEAMVRHVYLTGRDVILGSRFLDPSGSTDSVPWLKKRMLKAATSYTRASERLPVTDTHNGLRVLSRHAASVIRINHRGMAHASEILREIKRHELTWMEMPVNVDYTSRSRTKGQSVWNSVNILWDLVWRGSV